MSKNKRRNRRDHAQQNDATATGAVSADNQPAGSGNQGNNENEEIRRGLIRRLVEKLDELTIQRIALVVAVGLLGITWYQSYMVSQTLRETRREFTAGQRPFVTLGRNDGTVAKFAVSKSGPVGLKIYLQNAGLSPALSVNIGLLMSPINLLAKGQSPSHAFRPLSQEFRAQARTVNTNGSASGGGISIAPHSQYVKLLPNQFSREQWKRMIACHEAPTIWGQFDYCDEFGHYSCRQFILFYQCPTFIEVSQTNCVDLYGVPPRRKGEKYLLPCEQPSERQQREERERNLLLERIAKANQETPIPQRTVAPTPSR